MEVVVAILGDGGGWRGSVREEGYCGGGNDCESGWRKYSTPNQVQLRPVVALHS